MQLRNGRFYQYGVTITELLVGMTVGLIVVGMVLNVYLTTLGTSGDTLKSGRLNHEMAAIMKIMANDIRRAGYADHDLVPDWDGDGLINYLDPTSNPFNERGVSALEVRSATNVDQLEQGDGPCIVYAYDFVRDGALEEEESFGFRLNTVNNSVEMRRSIAVGEAINTCADTTVDDDDATTDPSPDADGWVTLNDENATEITNLNFDLGDSSCVNSAEPNNDDDDGDGVTDEEEEADCYAVPPSAGDFTVERRDVVITLEARLVDDTSVRSTLSQRVAVRNDLVRER